MPREIDYSLLDRPEILQFVFYPRRDWTTAPPGAADYMVPVEENVRISCRFYPVGPEAPTLLYFHGNGEVASDHDWIAPIYNRQGISLFVADYRGYGRSDGRPSFSAMTRDAHTILRLFQEIRQAEHYDGPVFVMGRSLGSHSALELAAHHASELRGVIIESGLSSPSRLLRFLPGGFDAQEAIEDFERASIERIRSITLPILIMHGEWDSIVPLEQALVLHENVGSRDRRLLIVPRAEHNDIMLVGHEAYFGNISLFVQDYSTSS